MMKLGVYRPNQYQQNSARTLLPKRARLAYRLLRTSIPPSPQEIEMFDGIMRHVHLAQGVYRTTAPGRFDHLDAFVAPILESHFRSCEFTAEAPLCVEDWAASACITAAEWFECLEKSFRGQIRFNASDLHLHLFEIQLPDGGSFIVEADGHVLQYVKPPFVIPLNRDESVLLPVNRWVQSKARRKFDALQKEGALDGLEQNTQQEWRKGGYAYRRIPLIHPKALAFTQIQPAFRIQAHSVFAPLATPCHLIRTMNILNLSYFDHDQLMSGVRAVWQSLQFNGLWIVGRTIRERQGETPAVHHTSVLKRTESGFEVLERYGAASEVEDLGLAFKG